MSKRILGPIVVAVVVLGLAGVAFASTGLPERPSYGLDEQALALAADPAPADPAPAGAAAGAGGGKRAELQACVKPKVDAGTDRKAAVKECAAQLGTTAGQGRKPGGKPHRLGRAAHAEFVVPKRDAEGQWETIVVDRGTVTAASAAAVSVQRPDGPAVTVKVTGATKVKGAASAAALAVGREVVVVSAAGEARSIVARR